jgi:formylglycine-generating enzyme required for sulfatase activity
VETVSWYDCVEYCNKRSRKEGLRPYYNIDRNKKDPNNTNKDDVVKWTATINARANGYRLPTEMEWEYAAGGGAITKSYTYSGGNDVDQVAWYYRNAGDKPITGAWFGCDPTETITRRSRRGQEANELTLRYVWQRAGVVLGLVR